AVSLGYFMVILDTTVVNVALATLGRSLHAGTDSLQWVVDGYAVVFAALLISMGTVGDRLGARRVLLAGLALFTVASAACGVAPAAIWLVVRRTPSARPRPGRLDVGAQVAAVVGLGALTYGLIEHEPAAVALAAAALAAFVFVERRVADPMLPLGMFRAAGFTAGSLVGLLINLGFYGQLFVLSLWLQRV